MENKIKPLMTAFAATTKGVWVVKEERDRKACNSKVVCEAGYVVAEGYSSPSSHIKYNDLWAEAEGNTNFIALAHICMPTLFNALTLLRKATAFIEPPADLTAEEASHLKQELGEFCANLEGCE